MAVNMIKNSDLLQSTNGKEVIMDSEARMREFDLGMGVAPDYWYYLGGPDYPDWPNGVPDSFRYAGGQWSDRSVDGDPTISKSILLDIDDWKVNDPGNVHGFGGGSHGVTQVVPIFQNEIKPIRFSCFCAGENLDGSPKVLFDVIGYNPGESNGANIMFFTGTFDFRQQRRLANFPFPVKYAFCHFYMSGFNHGKAWFAKPFAEELDVIQIKPNKDNRAMNFNFQLTSNYEDTVGWDTVNCDRLEEATPLGNAMLLMHPNGKIEQDAIVVDVGFNREWVSFYAKSRGTSRVRITATGRGRHRNKVHEKSEEFDLVDSWINKHITLICTPSIEKVDVKFEHVSGDPVEVGGIIVSDEDFPAIHTINHQVVHKETKQVTLPELPKQDETIVVPLDEPTDIDHVQFIPDDFNGNIYLTNGKFGRLRPYRYWKDYITVIKKKKMRKLSDTEFTILPWNDDIVELFLNDAKLNQYIGIPHIGHTDKLYLTTGGQIPANDTRYYCVTALTDAGETGRSNETRHTTQGTTSTNRVVIEITPVVGAKKYRVYMTKQFLPNPDWKYQVAAAQELVWADNSLIAEITAQELIDMGYVFYDTGAMDANPLPGKPPLENTARLWTKDSVNKKIVLESPNYGAGDVYAGYTTDIGDVRGVKFVPHTQELFITSSEGVFQSDSLIKKKLYQVGHDTTGIALDIFDGDLYYMTSDEVIHKIPDIENTGYPGLYLDNVVGFKWIDSETIYRFYANGKFRKFDLDGNMLEERTVTVVNANFIGFSMYFDKFLTIDKNGGSLIVFDSNGTIVQSIPFVTSGIQAWDLSGTILTAVVTGIGIIQYNVWAQEYYARLDDFAEIGKPIQYPTSHRPLLPGEMTMPEYPEMVPNANFTYGDALPTGFRIYGDTANVTWGFSDDVAIPDSRSFYFQFKKATWASINRYDLSIVGDVYYVFSFWVKANFRTQGLLGVKFKDSDGNGVENFYSFYNELTYQEKQFILKAPHDAVAVDFRILNYGTDTQGVMYNVNSISIKEDVRMAMSGWEHLFNGNFSIYPTGGVAPIGYWLGGGGSGGAVTAIEDPVMQPEGKAWRIYSAPYDNQLDNWLGMFCQKYDINEGDELELSFRFRTDRPTDSSILVGIELYDAQNNRVDVVYKNAWTVGNNTHNMCKVKFDAIPAGIVRGGIFIWSNCYGYTAWFEKFSMIPVSSEEKLSNNDFATALSGWSLWNAAPRIGDSVRNLPDGGVEVVPNCAIVEVDLTKDPLITYSDIRQNIYFNQITPTQIRIAAIFRAETKTPAWWGTASRWEMCVSYMDGTDVWNEDVPVLEGTYDANYYPNEFEEWSERVYTINPSKPIKNIWFILATGWSGEGALYVKYTSVRELKPIPTFDAIDLVLPYNTIASYNPLGNSVQSMLLTAQLMNQGVPVQAKGIQVDFSVTPNSGSQMLTLPTNEVGIAKAVFQIPDALGVFTISATVGNITTSENVIVYPRVNGIVDKPAFKPFPDLMDKLYLEVITERARKPIPLVPDRVGSWEVFRPTIFNIEQMPDYEMHYSPESLWAELRPEKTSARFPKSMYFEYFDYLADYPYEAGHIEIKKVRKEWYCLEATGYSQPFGDGRSYYNWRDLECTQWYTDRFLQRMMIERNYADGAYLDDFWGESYDVVQDFEWAAKPSAILNYRSIEERIMGQRDGLMFMRKELHKRGRWLTCNYGVPKRFDFSGPEPVMYSRDAVLAEPFDGYLREVWLYGDTKKPKENTNQWWNLNHLRNEIEFLRWANKQGKWVVVLARQDIFEYETRMFCMAAYLLGKGDMSYYCYTQWENGWWTYGSDWHDPIHPEQKIITGLPKSDYVYDGDNFFSREFENCVALLNFGHTPKTYTLPEGTWYTIRGEEFTGDITLEWRDAYVLVKERP